ncbi:SCO0930 family lipoprotein [Streptomyces sp. NPDC101118]|uniref:SCO0930 family lipoprotein n=1 Tax=Streptomyces sp. NPDC101118 TaxID=3366109 RepID=UPI0037F83A80
MGYRRREKYIGSAVAVLLLTAGCGVTQNRAAPAGNSVREAGGGSPIGSGSGSGSGYDSGYGSGSDGGYGTAGGGSGADPGSGYGGGSGMDHTAGAKTGPAGRLAARDVAGVGTVVADGKGWTLYRFDKDSASPPKSACDGDCAKAWPPVPAADADATGSVDPALLGSVTRSDGTRQLTLGGWPVYRYAKDTAPGQAKGEGVGGTWHALAPDGGKAADGAEESGAEDRGTDGVQLSVARDPALGKIAVTGTGMTLYRFDKDSAWPMRLGCKGACLEKWKPAPAVDPEKVEGINGKLVGSVRRPDGSRQLTIDCWPVYWFTGDKKAGDTNGHGAQGLWWAVTDTGKKAPAAAG